MELHGYIWNSMDFMAKSMRLLPIQAFHSHENQKNIKTVSIRLILSPMVTKTHNPLILLKTC